MQHSHFDISLLLYFPQGAPPLPESTPPDVFSSSGSRIAQFVASDIPTLNAALAESTSEWMLMCLPIQTPTPELFDQALRLVSDNPHCKAFFRLFPLQNTEYSATLSEFERQLCAIVPTCVLVHRQSLLEWGGLAEGASHSWDVDLYLRCHERMANSGRNDFAVCTPNTLSALPATDGVLTFGLERVGQLARLAQSYMGRAPAFWFLVYAERLRTAVVNAQARNLILADVDNILETLARHIAYRIKLGEQHHLAPYLRRSVFDSPCQDASDGSIDPLDSQVLKFWDRPAGVYPLHPELRCYSLGLNCHATQTLKRLGLRHHPGPFDWIFSNFKSAAHMLEDGFTTFLDVNQCQPVDAKDKQDPMSNVAEHEFYRRAHGVRFMFNHHNLHNPEHLDYFQEAVECLLDDLASTKPCLLLLMAPHGGVKPELLDPVLKQLRAIGPSNKLLVVEPKPTAGESMAWGMNAEKDMLCITLEACSPSTGTEFQNPDDDIRLQRIVHAAATAWFL